MRDLADGYAFYEAQEAGLGDYFATCLRADIESLRLYAGIGRIVHADYHRLLSRVFPYGVFYTIESDLAATRWMPQRFRHASAGPFRADATSCQQAP